jgi:carbon monoxide dehydrogenase subunit G
VAPIVSEVDVARPPDEVFRYVTDPSRFGEWQSGVVSAHIEGDGPAAVGSLCIMTRRIGGQDRTSTSEITELSPPRTWAIRGIDGPVRANVTVTVDPRQDGTQAHVAIQLDLQGVGMGKLIMPVVVREASKEVPESCQKLKARLESGSGDPAQP